MLRIDYEPEAAVAVISWESADDGSAWLAVLREALVSGEGSSEITNRTWTLPWWRFLSQRAVIGQLRSAFGLVLGVEIDVSPRAVAALTAATVRSRDYLTTPPSDSVDRSVALRAQLSESGFERVLTDRQVSNVIVLSSRSSGATFSVPGAGKSTEALATYVLRRNEGDKLLIVCPKNALGSWDNEIAACIPTLAARTRRLTGGNEGVQVGLHSDAAVYLITYQQLVRVQPLVQQFVASGSVHVFLDESHRVKGGASTSSGAAVLRLSHIAKSKLILSGTPMPQATADLVPQFSFLYPEIAVDETTVVDAIRPIFVRTTKKQLGLRRPDVIRRSTEMAPAQAELYGLLRSQIARDARFALHDPSNRAFRILGRSVIRAIQAASNPMLLVDSLEGIDPGLFGDVMREGDSPKVKAVIERAENLVRHNQKVVIWTSFVKNVEYLAWRLNEHGSVYIHGGVGAGADDSLDTREGRIKNFLEPSGAMVMVANPAAAGEGISLHSRCHHALYLDRTFNAGHFLQSQDRIHRYGLEPDQRTTIELFEAQGSVDQIVSERVAQKVDAMGKVLDDPDLQVQVEAEDYNGDEEDADSWDRLAEVSYEDVLALARSED